MSVTQLNRKKRVRTENEKTQAIDYSTQQRATEACVKLQLPRIIIVYVVVKSSPVSKVAKGRLRYSWSIGIVSTATAGRVLGKVVPPKVVLLRQPVHRATADVGHDIVEHSLEL